MIRIVFFVVVALVNQASSCMGGKAKQLRRKGENSLPSQRRVRVPSKEVFTEHTFFFLTLMHFHIKGLGPPSLAWLERNGENHIRFLWV